MEGIEKLEKSRTGLEFKDAILSRTESQKSWKSYAYRLRGFLKWAAIEADELVAGIESREIDAVELINSYLRSLRERGLAPKTLRTEYGVVKKFLEVNLERGDINWKKVRLPKGRNVEEALRPTKEIFREALEHGGAKDRAIVLFAASSGAREGSIAGLTVGDVDMDAFEDVAVVNIRAEIGKDKVGYVTFITPEAKEALARYLELRRRQGEEIGPESPLFCGKPGKFARADTIGQRWMRLLTKAGLKRKRRRRHDYHFHKIRSFFRTQLEGCVTASYRARLMGHSGAGDTKTYLDASYFDPAFDELLAAYRTAIGELTVEEFMGEERMKTLEEKLAETEALTKKIFRFGMDRVKEQMRDLGVDTSKTPHELAKEMGVLEQWRMSEEEIRELVKGIGAKQKVIPEGELVAHLSGGWRFVAQLNNGSGKIIVER